VQEKKILFGLSADPQECSIHSLADDVRKNVEAVLKDVLEGIDAKSLAEKAWAEQKKLSKSGVSSRKQVNSADDGWKSAPRPQRSSRNAALEKRCSGCAFED